MLVSGAFLLLLAQPPVIDLITMGPGDYVFSRWGHSAICVSGPAEARCYNYGTADFSTPGPLTWAFIRGRALFWVSVVPPDLMFAAYEREDRTVWRQRLSLTSTQAEELAERLEASTAEDVRFYRYHHFKDNCTTRIRDHLDVVTRGGLSGLADPTPPTTFRREARRGFAGEMALELAADLLLGRRTDSLLSSWESMFLPEVLMDNVELQLGAPPEVVYLRKGSAPPAPSSPLSRAFIVLFVGVILALMLRQIRRHPTRVRIGAGLLGGTGLLLWIFAALTRVPELRENELLLVLVPFDLVMPFLAERGLPRYLVLRKLQLAFVLILGLLGLLTQPIWPVVGSVGLVLVGLDASARPRA